ncbi:MAG: cbb3-type cytochrome c oxidase subunit II [Chthoniobacterales bacterium]
MKGVTGLFLGIFGTFAFSWTGLTLIPNWQIGHLDPQSDEEQTDIYPQPKSGMAERGRKIYAANGCVYCHSQQVRADYAASDIERKWGTRRSAPRDYIFERPAMLGKLRMGPDLSNIGKRAPAEDQNPSPSPAPSASASASPAANTSPAANVPAPSPNASAANSPAAAPNASPVAGASASPAASANASPAPATSPGPAATTAETTTSANGGPPQYSAAWHHLHLYNPRSVLAGSSSNMPSFKFLYETRRITGERSADALKLTGADDPGEGWEVIPTYDAKCLVAYLMSLDQSHELKEAKLSTAPATASSPAPAASAGASPAASPAPAKEEKK